MIQFSDRAEPLCDLFYDLDKSLLTLELHDALFSLNYFPHDTKLLTPDNDYVNSLTFISTSVKWRQTSRQSDQALCLGVLAGIDTKRIWKQLPENRMFEFWKCLKDDIPSTMMFDCFQEKMDHDGLRWAPANFLNPIADTLIGVKTESDQYHCIRDDNGLRVTYPGVLLFPAILALPRPVSVFWISKNWLAKPRYLVVLDRCVSYDSKDGSHKYVDPRYQDLKEYTIIPKPIPFRRNVSPSRPALILSGRPEPLDHQDLGNAVRAVLVKIYVKRGDGQFHAQSLASGIVKSEEGGSYSSRIRAAQRK